MITRHQQKVFAVVDDVLNEFSIDDHEDTENTSSEPQHTPHSIHNEATDIYRGSHDDGHDEVSPDTKLWRRVLAEQMDTGNRIWLYRFNLQVSPCESFVAFHGCNRDQHEEDCDACEWGFSRVGIGRRAEEIIEWLPVINDKNTTFGHIRFDRFSRLYLFQSDCQLDPVTLQVYN